MTFLIDRHIPYLNGLLEPYARVEYLEPEEFTPQRVRSADALVIRTRTRCDAALLDGSQVRFIATATIGCDHIDADYCRRHGIQWTNCPGCNAQGVCDYVMEAVRSQESGARNQESTIGIVGVGHVGSLVAAEAQAAGMRVIVNDPPKRDELIASGVDYRELADLAAQADILTLHTPLTRDGRYPTWHLIDGDILKLCKPRAVIINAARGGILDEQAALAESNASKTFIIDTWEGEPQINHDMLRRSSIATYHIAGYTRQGKLNATRMCLQALSDYFHLPAFTIDEKVLPLQPQTQSGWLMSIDAQLREYPDMFEQLRSNYQLR